MYYVYILKSSKDKKLYIGKTKNLKRRIKEHNQGKVISTKGRRPFKLIFYEAFLDNSDAVRDEKLFKSGFGREILDSKLKSILMK